MAHGMRHCRSLRLPNMWGKLTEKQGAACTAGKATLPMLSVSFKPKIPLHWFAVTALHQHATIWWRLLALPALRVCACQDAGEDAGCYHDIAHTTCIARPDDDHLNSLACPPCSWAGQGGSDPETNMPCCYMSTPCSGMPDGTAMNTMHGATKQCMVAVLLSRALGLQH